MNAEVLSERLNRWWREGVRVVELATWDEPLAERALARLADMRAVPLLRWSVVSGLSRPADPVGAQLSRDPETFLDKVLALPAGVVMAYDLWLDPLSPRARRSLRELARREAPFMLVVVVPPGSRLPAELQQEVVRLPLGDQWSPRFRAWRESPDPDLRRAVARQGLDTPGLELVTTHGGWSRVGGLDRLKAWSRQRARALEPGSRLPFPRGVLLYGIPGTGKSLSVHAWAAEWQLPLLRLHWAGLLGRYVGQSEAQLDAALAAAERLSPAILWVDEIDKAFGDASDAQDGGVSRRLVGSLLTWLQDHESPVLLLATANDIAGIPAELWRPGRFDALFFVDLPDMQAREEILQIHLRRAQVADGAPYRGVTASMQDFSGADIAAAVTDAEFLAAERGVPLSPAILEEAAQWVIPWARTLDEELARRRAWAQGRLRPA